MKIARCKNGHYYNSSESADCPECVLGGSVKPVPVEPFSEPSLQVVRCEQGHYYDGALGRCPVCGSGVSRPGNTQVRCPEGHLYNGSIYQTCPECASEESARTVALDRTEFIVDDIQETVPVSKPELTMQITQCDKGHYYDAGLGACPICAAGMKTELEQSEKNPLVRCSQGHVYDSSVTPECPLCAAEADQKTVALEPPLFEVEDVMETVPASQADFSMGIVRCANGHYYDSALGSCPVCDAQVPARTEPEEPRETAEVRTEFEAEDIMQTVPASQADLLPGILSCGKGHYYDAGLGVCPICAAEKPLEECAADAEDQSKIQTVSRAVFEYTQECPRGHYYKPEFTECPICAQAQKIVPVSEFELDPQPIRCEDGESYDRELEECTEEAQTEQEEGTVLLEQWQTVTCSEGHVYDPAVTPECPVCAMEKPLEAALPVQKLQLEEDGSSDAEQEENLLFADEVQEKPESEPVTCPKGHRYDPAFTPECPFCAAEEAQARDSRFAQLEDVENTLIFTAWRGMSFRLWMDREGMKLTVRSRIRKPDLIIENTVAIGEQQAAAAAYQIQSVLFQFQELGLDRIFAEGNGVGEDARLLLRTVQINCDYRWKENSGVSSQCMYQIHAILGRTFDRLTTVDSGYLLKQDNLLAALEFSYNPECRIYREEGRLWLELRDRFYYEFVSSFVLADRVALPEDTARELLRELAGGGIMEALIRKNQLPGTGLCIDPGFATVFYLKWNDLTYSYRDWNKEGDGTADAAMKKAYDRLLEVYMQQKEV